MEWKTNQEPFAQPGAEPCKEFAERMYLLVADELAREEQSLLESHATGCGACAAFVAEIREMKGALGTAPRQEVNADLLAACRAELSDALDDIEASKDRGRVARWFDLNLPTAMGRGASGGGRGHSIGCWIFDWRSASALARRYARASASGARWFSNEFRRRGYRLSCAGRVE